MLGGYFGGGRDIIHSGYQKRDFFLEGKVTFQLIQQKYL